MANEELIERIDAVSPTWARTMRDYPTDFVWQPVPFYHKFRYLLATVSFSNGPSEFHYADDGSRLCLLGATPEYIYTVNQLEGLQLDAAQVPAYIRFFFDNLAPPRIQPVERPEEVRWLQHADREPDRRALKERAASLILPMRVTPLDEDSYRVLATAVAGTRLIEVDLVVQRNGHIDVKNERVLVERIPVVQVFY
jgi:hypothetical protein